MNIKPTIHLLILQISEYPLWYPTLFQVVVAQSLSRVWLPATPWTTRLLCPSLSPRVCSNSCALSQWCHPIISSSVAPFSSCPQSFPASGSFPIKLALHIRWPQYWNFSFSINPSNEYSGLIFSRIDWLDLLIVQAILKSLLHHKYWTGVSCIASRFFYHLSHQLLSCFSRAQLCATPWTAAHQASPSMGFSRQEHWSGLPFPSPMHESGKLKWSRSVVSES